MKSWHISVLFLIILSHSGHDNGSTHEASGGDDGNSRSGGSRHGSQDTPASPAPRRTVAAASVPVTPAKLAKFVLRWFSGPAYGALTRPLS